ncbi:hypothetical protein SAMN05444166_7206 [Singulisphaera sp. GP187]|nr:hypothetical protein SAMN05444166_7206 [Singulisphaera sp. GP187]
MGNDSTDGLVVVGGGRGAYVADQARSGRARELGHSRTERQGYRGR